MKRRQVRCRWRRRGPIRLDEFGREHFQLRVDFQARGSMPWTAGHTGVLRRGSRELHGNEWTVWCGQRPFALCASSGPPGGPRSPCHPPLASAGRRARNARLRSAWDVHVRSREIRPETRGGYTAHCAGASASTLRQRVSRNDYVGCPRARHSRRERPARILGTLTVGLELRLREAEARESVLMVPSRRAHPLGCRSPPATGISRRDRQGLTVSNRLRTRLADQSRSAHPEDPPRPRMQSSRWNAGATEGALDRG